MNLKSPKSIAWPSLVLSAIAICFSLFSFYFQFVRISSELKASILAMEMKDGGQTLVISAALINTGNRDVLMKEAYPIKVLEGRHFKLEGNAYLSIGKAQSPAGLPAVLKAGEIRLITFQVPFVASQLYYYGGPSGMYAGPNNDIQKFPVGVFFSCMNWKGKPFNVYPLFANVNINPTTWLGFEILKPEERVFQLVW